MSSLRMTHAEYAQRPAVTALCSGEESWATLGWPARLRRRWKAGRNRRNLQPPNVSLWPGVTSAGRLNTLGKSAVSGKCANTWDGTSRVFPGRRGSGNTFSAPEQKKKYLVSWRSMKRGFRKYPGHLTLGNPSVIMI